VSTASEHGRLKLHPCSRPVNGLEASEGPGATSKTRAPAGIAYYIHFYLPARQQHEHVVDPFCISFKKTNCNSVNIMGPHQFGSVGKVSEYNLSIFLYPCPPTFERFGLPGPMHAPPRSTNYKLYQTQY